MTRGAKQVSNRENENEGMKFEYKYNLAPLFLPLSLSRTLGLPGDDDDDDIMQLSSKRLIQRRRRRLYRSPYQ